MVSQWLHQPVQSNPDHPMDNPAHSFTDDFRNFVVKAKADSELLELLGQPRPVGSVVEIAKSNGFIISEDDVFKSKSNEADQVLDGIGWAYCDDHVHFFSAY
jgi:hypothetical protein